MTKRFHRRWSTFLAMWLMGASCAFVGRDCVGQSSDSLTDQFERQYQDGKYSDAEATARSGLSQAEATNESVPIGVWQHNLAMSLDAQGKYRDAVTQYDESRRRLEQALGPDHLQVALSLNNLANTYSNLGEFARAKTLHERARQIRAAKLGKDHLLTAQCVLGLGGVCQRMGDFEAADAAFSEVLPIIEKQVGRKNDSYIAVLGNVALLHATLARYEEAEKEYAQTLALVAQLHGENHPRFADVLGNLGALYMLREQYALAEPLLKKAASIRRSTLGADHPQIAVSLNNLGALYNAQNETASAQKCYQEALAVLDKSVGPEHPDYTAALSNLGESYRMHGNYDEAERLFTRALELLEKKVGPNGVEIANLKLGLAGVYFSRKRYAEATTNYEEALRIRERALGTSHSELVRPLMYLALVEKEQNHSAAAESLATRAIDQCVRSNAPPSDQYLAYAVRSLVRWERDEKEKSIDDLAKALDATERMRRNTAGGEQQTAEVARRLVNVSETMIAHLAALGRPAEAFAYSERSRARSLVDQCELAGVNLMASLPSAEGDQLQSRWKAANSRVASLRQQLALAEERRSQEEANSLALKLTEARSELAEAYRDIRNSSAAYRLAVSRSRQPVSLDSLQSLLAKEKGLLLEYLIGDDEAGLFVVKPVGNPEFIPLALNEKQAKQLGTTAGPLTADRLRAVLANEQNTGLLQMLRNAREAPTATASLAVLYQVLIPGAVRQSLAAEKPGCLIVVPDGPLALLPFETLVVEERKDPQYLLDAGPPIAYAPSATVLCNLAGKPEIPVPTDLKPVLTVGDPLYAEPDKEQAGARDGGVLTHVTARSRYARLGGRLERLPFSGKESAWVDKVFTQSGLKVGRLLQSDATEGNVRYNVPGRRIVHLACHGFAEQEYGNLFGSLVLAPGPKAESDSADDGYLTLAELYELDLKGCELAIMSACETNYGPQQKGEGVWALSRGLLVAGARRVVASNWLVDDEAAASLISYFCGSVAISMQRRQPVDYALRLHRAKKWVRDQEKWQSPYYWGTFVLVGPN